MRLCTWWPTRDPATRAAAVLRACCLPACAACACRVAGARACGPNAPARPALPQSQALLASVSATTTIGYAHARVCARDHGTREGRSVAAFAPPRGVRRAGAAALLRCSASRGSGTCAQAGPLRRRSNLALRGGGFSLAKPGSLKAAAKTEVPDWYRGSIPNGNVANLLVRSTPSHAPGPLTLLPRPFARGLMHACEIDCRSVSVHVLRRGILPSPSDSAPARSRGRTLCARCHAYRATQSSRASLPWASA